ncbi:IMP dehydrogenase [archaeon]|nr:IMP dehydrogenase [archaeon]
MREGLTFNDVLLVPKKSVVNSRSDVNTETQLSKNISLKIPLISASMDTVTESNMAIAMAECGGLGIIHRFLSIEDQVNEVKKVKEKNLMVGAAIGIRNDYLKRIGELINAKVDVLSLDVAHAHSYDVINVIKEIKFKFPNKDLIVGNVATKEGARDLISSGADAIKVGVGPGSTCTTRVITGAGVPQLSAILDCFRICNEKNIPLIADGGIQTSGDFTKALVAGASCVMCGNLFAGTDESPGEIIEKDGKKYKSFRGMASRSAAISNFKKNSDSMGVEKLIMPEGVEAIIEYKGKIIDVVEKLVAGLRSGISYCGAKNIKGMQGNYEFIKITEASYKESVPHHIEFY